MSLLLLHQKFLLSPAIQALIFIYSVLLLMVWFIEDILLFDWIVSFMPVWTVFNMAFLIVSTFIILYDKKKDKLLSKKFASKVFGVATLIVLTVFFATNILNTYTIRMSTFESDGNSKIAFFNKLYSNTKNSGIAEYFIEQSFDFVGMAEVDYKDYVELKENLVNLYPYSYFRNDGQDPWYGFVSVAVFSKSPLKIIPSPKDFPRSVVAETDLNGKMLRFYVIHTYAPLYQDYFAKRNPQFDVMGRYFSNIDTSNTILMGDMNISDWSPTFREFKSRVFPMTNAFDGQGIHISWGPTKIDHIFVGKDIAVSNCGTKGDLGSDHRVVFCKIIY